MTSTVSQNVIDKGTRLVDAGLVANGPRNGEYRVKGDHGLYRVVIAHVDESGITGYCDCPAYRACSHLFAAMVHGERTGTLPTSDNIDDPFARIV